MRAWFEMRTSIPPAAVTVVLTTAAAVSGSQRSTAIGIASAPYRLTSAATDSSRRASSTSAMWEAPSRARPIAVACPNPAPAPVTSARRPANRLSPPVSSLATVRTCPEPLT